MSIGVHRATHLMGHMEDQREEVDELFDGDDNGDNNGFEVHGRLTSPEVLPFTTLELFHLIHEGAIELNPPYQRGMSRPVAWRQNLIAVEDVVWPESKMIQLLDSIYRNFYIPPLLFVQVKLGGIDVLRCVDGKQRLMSIQRFFDGHVRFYAVNMCPVCS